MQLAARIDLQKKYPTERWMGITSSSQNHQSYREIDEADHFTPHDWIPRASNLIRSTRKHPLSKLAPVLKLVIWKGIPSHFGSVTPFAEYKE